MKTSTLSHFEHRYLIDNLWNFRSNRLIRNLILMVTGSLLIWLSAKIQIPFYPVPITMQTMVVLVLGMTYGPQLGLMTILLYLTGGAFGLPVFAGTPEKGIGLAYMLGPTGGYLLGFVVATMVVGWFSKKGWDRNHFQTVVMMILGNIVIYGFGIFWLGNMLGWDQPILEWGLYPFLIGDLFKIILAAIMLPTIWKWVNR